ncbi:MAG: hypothetical protein K2Y17_05360 [Qipengyuania sp.]|nr:hypothetical protein [Qipengyuania sp.]
MKRALLAAAASLALAVPAGVAIAQDTAATAAHAMADAMTDTQRTMYEGWPADRRTSYDAWPSTYRTYYWTLTPAQQSGWWALTDEQRARVYAMTPEQRTAAWASITAQMAGAAPVGAAPTGTTHGTMHTGAMSHMDTTSTTAHSDMSGTMATSGDMQFVRRELAQPVAAHADAAALQSGDVPVCKKGQQDGCINGWEKNKSGNKPLSYWPGKPASEIPGKKPDPQ